MSSQYHCSWVLQSYGPSAPCNSGALPGKQWEGARTHSRVAHSGDKQVPVHEGDTGADGPRTRELPSLEVRVSGSPSQADALLNRFLLPGCCCVSCLLGCLWFGAMRSEAATNNPVQAFLWRPGLVALAEERDVYLHRKTSGHFPSGCSL